MGKHPLTVVLCCCAVVIYFFSYACCSYAFQAPIYIMQMYALAICACLYIMLSYVMPSAVRQMCIGSWSLISWCQGVGVGCVLSLVINSSVIALSQWLSIDHHQVAYSILLSTPLGYMRTLMIVTIVIICPYVEEFLFRGMIYSSLRCVYTPQKTALIVSALFAAIHYAPVQGCGNSLIIGSLFIFAFVASYVRYRNNGIAASVGLHMAFNGCSVLLFLYGW